MKIGIEHFFTDKPPEINFATGLEHALALMAIAMRREGWSNSSIVNASRLPLLAAEDWEQRVEAAQRYMEKSA